MFLIELRKVVGGTETILPLYAEETVTDVFNDSGLIEFSYPLDEAKLNGLNDGVEIKATTVGGKVFIGEIQGTGTDYNQDGAIYRRFSVPTGMAYLDFATVYSSAWPSPLPQNHGFVQNNSGTIIRTLMTRATGRGTLTDIDVSTFSGSSDSNGASWLKLITLNIDVGTTYLQAFKDLCEQGMCDIRFEGKSMRVYNQGTTNTVRDFVFRRGHNVNGMTEETSSTERGTVVLVGGEEGAAIEVKDNTAIAAYRRRERYLSVGGIADSATLGLIGTAELDGRKYILTEVNLAPVMDPTTGPFPWQDYKTGDWVYYEADGSAIQVQIKQITAGVNADGTPAVTVTIGTLLDDLQAKLARKINAITGGNNGNYGAIPASLEYMAPAPPAAVNVAPNGYLGNNGQTYSQVTVSWPAVTTNSDGTTINDLSGYEVQWLLTGSDWSGSVTTADTAIYVSNLVPGLGFTARVRAFDREGNYGAWRYSGQDGSNPTGVPVTLPGDTTAPPVPSTPTASALLNTARVSWDGKGSVGEAMPADYNNTEVHLSTTGSTFTITPGTLVGTLTGSGTVTVSTPTVGTTYYVRLANRDRSGNLSAGSTAVAVSVLSAVPSTPTVTSVPAGIRVFWNGQNAAGQTMTMAAGVEVHISTVSGFTPVVGGAGNTLDGYITIGGGEHIVYGVNYDTTYYVRLVAVDDVLTRGGPSTQATGTARRISDPDLPAKLITGAKIADAAIAVRNLTVAAFDDNAILNGDFEASDPASTPTADRPYHWVESWNTGSPTWTTTTTSPLSGLRSLTMTLPSASAFQRIANSEPIPCAPGDIFYLKVLGRASRAVALSNALELTAVFSTTQAKSLAIFDAEATWVQVSQKPGTTSTQILEGSATCPGNMFWVRFLISGNASGDGSGWTAVFDDAEMRKIVGEAAIANASISNAKIQNLAVDDAKIGSVSVGKVTAGTITANWLLAGNIRTAASGARVELNTNGFQAYNSSNVKTVDIKSSDGSAALTGSISASTVSGSTISGSAAYFPDSSNATGWMSLDDDGFALWIDDTTNLVTNPSFENTPTFFKSNGSIETVLKGALVYDAKGNPDIRSAFGTSALRIRYSSGNGYVGLRMATLASNTTYTFSFHCSMTPSSDVGFLPGTAGYADASNLGVWEVGGSVRKLAGGHDGYIVTEGPFSGKYYETLTSGAFKIANEGWSLRHWVTFTTPSGLASSGLVEIRLPVPRTSGNGNNSDGSYLVYDGLQIEQKSQPTAYTDGDQFGAFWNGTRHSSTSTRYGQPSVIFPTYGDNFVGGRIKTTEVTADVIKVGSATPRGTNAVEVYNNDGSTVPISTWTDIGFSTLYSERVTADDGAILVSTNLFTSQVAGFFAYHAAVSWPILSGTGSIRAMRWITQGASVFAQDQTSASGIANMQMSSVSGVVWLPGNGYQVRCQVWHNNGATQTLPGNAGGSPYRATFAQVI